MILHHVRQNQDHLLSWVSSSLVAAWDSSLKKGIFSSRPPNEAFLWKKRFNSWVRHWFTINDTQYIVFKLKCARFSNELHRHVLRCFNDEGWQTKSSTAEMRSEDEKEKKLNRELELLDLAEWTFREDRSLAVVKCLWWSITGKLESPGIQNSSQIVAI
jgi:hypothetical protein